MLYSIATFRYRSRNFRSGTLREQIVRGGIVRKGVESFAKKYKLGGGVVNLWEVNIQ